jgi:2-oxoglutarate ferredoxin oxidoreductase subunit beta
MVALQDFRSEKPTWCPGCGLFSILSALKRACVNMGLNPWEICLVSGIGCSGKTSSYFNSYGFHVLHGRALPVATGVKLANRNLKVIVVGGDGDGYAIGLSHFIHAVRRNIDLTYVVGNNRIYGLTAGQTSPTSLRGFKTKTTPKGSVEEAIHPAALAMAEGITYLAQGFSGDISQLTRLIQKGIEHKGFAHIDVFSPCVTFNRVNTYDWYREKLINLDEGDYDPSDRKAAIGKVMDLEGIYTGLIYREEGKPTYEEVLPGLGERPMVKMDIKPDMKKLKALLEGFA